MPDCTNESAVVIRKLKPGEEWAAFQVVRATFNEFVAPLYSPQGRRNVLAFAHPSQLARRIANGQSFVLIAVSASRVVGVLEMRGHDHISMLFIAGDWQRRGIARRLVDTALIHIQEKSGSTPGAISVHASPNAVAAYRCLGFQPTAGERVQDGIRYVPMERQLSDSRGNRT